MNTSSETAKKPATWTDALGGCVFLIMLAVIGVVGFITGIKYLWLFIRFIWERV